MASVIRYIPNQPILFEADTQVKNSDDRRYAQMMADGDTMCVQWKQVAKTASSFGSTIDDDDSLWALVSGYNGTFTDNANGWTLGTGWAYGSNRIRKTAGVASVASFDFSDVVITSGETYYVTFTVSGRSAGSVTPFFGNGAGISYGTARSSNNTFTEIIAFSDVQADAIFGFSADNTFDGSIDDVIIMGVPDNLSEYWTQATTADPFVHVVGNTSPLQSYPNTISAGYHSVQFTITNSTAGTITASVGDGTATAVSGNGTFIKYITSTILGDVKLTPSSAFDGGISGVIVRTYETGHYVQLVSSTENSKLYDNTDPNYPLEYNDDRITWCFVLSLLEDEGALTMDQQCYQVKLTDNTDSSEHTSVTVINYPYSDNKTAIVVGDCDNDYAFGFYFGGVFTLRQRLRILRINPRYPSESDNYIYSTGVHKRNYSQTQKIWTAWFDFVDEPTHDVIRLQLLCDTLTIAGVQYHCPQDGYEPEWVENGKRNLARSKVELQKYDDVLFNRNC